MSFSRNHIELSLKRRQGEEKKSFKNTSTMALLGSVCFALHGLGFLPDGMSEALGNTDRAAWPRERHKAAQTCKCAAV